MPDASETRSHPVFGELGWLAEHRHWFARLPQPDGECLHVIVDPGDEDRDEFLEPAADLFRRAIQNETKIRRRAIRAELLELYNDTWRRSEEPVLTAEELAARLKLTLVEIDTVFPVTLHYEAGELFAGHGVAVELDERLRFVDVDIQG